MIDYKSARVILHDLAFRYGVRQPKLKFVNLSRRFHSYFGYSCKETSLKINGFYDYKTKTILLDPKRSTAKHLQHEFVHYRQHLASPKEFIAYEKKMKLLAKHSCKAWMKAYYSSKFEKEAGL
jgi:hypothetical protein